MISIIIPFFNEEENLPKLSENLIHELDKTKRDYEIVFVDDGSTDDSLEKLKNRHPKISVIKHRVRQGKGHALLSGFQKSTGDIVIFMDADLQNDPADLPDFLKKIESGYDFVNGIREKRKDNLLIKTYSSLGNIFLKTFLKSPFTDVNCGYKAMKRIVLEEIALYANNFRFLPIAANLKGFKVTEIPVRHHRRIHGVSKFGASKVFIGFFDTLTAYFIYRFAERPLHFFGPIGGIIFLTGFFISAYLAYERIFFGILLFRRPALQLGILLIIIGIQIIMTGIVGELIVFLNKKNNS